MLITMCPPISESINLHSLQVFKKKKNGAYFLKYNSENIQEPSPSGPEETTEVLCLALSFCDLPKSCFFP